MICNVILNTADALDEIALDLNVFNKKETVIDPHRTGGSEWMYIGRQLKIKIHHLKRDRGRSRGIITTYETHYFPALLLLHE